MQSQIDIYLDTAKRRQGLRSDRELSRRLGLSEGAVNAYRVGRSLPDDEIMVRLARLALSDPAEALITLNILRCKSADVRAIYSEMNRERHQLKRA